MPFHFNNYINTRLVIDCVIEAKVAVVCGIGLPREYISQTVTPYDQASVSKSYVGKLDCSASGGNHRDG